MTITREMWGNSNKPLSQKLLETLYERTTFQNALEKIKTFIEENEGLIDKYDCKEILAIINKAYENASKAEEDMKDLNEIR